MRKSNSKNQKRSIRNIVLNFVKANGPQDWTSLHQVVLIAAGQPLDYQTYGSSYLDKVSFGTSACLPTKTDTAYLVQSSVDGLYHYVAE